MSEIWTPPSQLPDIRAAKYIAFDSETKDPDLLTMGPGAPKGESHAIGYSLATEDGFKCYLPIRHEGGGNLAIEPVLRYVKDMLNGPSVKVAANILYDLEILRVDGIEVSGEIADIQIAEPLLDENKHSYSLENLGKFYFGEGKDEELLNDVADKLGIDRRSIKGYLYKLPSSYCGKYAEQDADLTLRIYLEQLERIKVKGLTQVFNLEMDVVRVLLDMRFRGVRVDVDKAEELEYRLAQEQQTEYDAMVRLCGHDVDIWSNVSIAGAASELGLPVVLTDAGNPSFEGDWLSKQDVPFYKHLLKCRRLDRAGSVFIRNKILGYQKNGLVYPRFRQVRGEDKGTKSGRFSSEGPNFQQVPARDDYLAPLVRSIYIPHEKGQIWTSSDIKAQEPRLTTHYGVVLGLRGADRIQKMYEDDPFTDFHNATAQMIKDVTGLTVDRRPAKNINLGIAYGMGKKKLALSTGLDLREAYDVIDAYDQAMPFVKQLGKECTRIAETRGFVKTILGRHRHFDLFGPKKWTAGLVPKRYSEAVREFGEEVVRYFTYKALNAIIQGSSADQIKLAMVLLWKEGLLPMLTLHDELMFSLNDIKEVAKAAEIMCTCLPNLTVPMASDIDVGPSWGEISANYRYSFKTGLQKKIADNVYETVVF